MVAGIESRECEDSLNQSGIKFEITKVVKNIQFL
jgi:hypothetical protein